MDLMIAAGARPNFMKVAPIIDALQAYNAASEHPVRFSLVHTGQHYDGRMSELFFRDLGLPDPDVNLEVGSGSQAWQTAEIMKRFEPICLDRRPSHVLVVGDVNSTIACALVARKLGIAVIHVEAGLRSFDRSMPEEINRVLTDAIADFLFVTEESGRTNLLEEGVAEERVHLVGNVMVDTLLKHREKAEQLDVLSRLGLIADVVVEYGLLTLHRPSNVDSRDTLQGLLEAVTEVSKYLPVIFPVHPRTARQIKILGLQSFFEWIDEDAAQVNERRSGIYAIKPMGYLAFLQLMANARVVLTDSGGIQEETTILKVPCVTIRENTERPVTLTHGTNRLAGTDPNNIVRAVKAALSSAYNGLEPPPLWDGKAAQRIVDVLVESPVPGGRIRKRKIKK